MRGAGAIGGWTEVNFADNDVTIFFSELASVVTFGGLWTRNSGMQAVDEFSTTIQYSPQAYGIELVMPYYASMTCSSFGKSAYGTSTSATCSWPGNTMSVVVFVSSVFV